MDILAEFPYLVVQDVSGLHYDGYISVHGKLYRLDVQVPKSGRLQDATISCDWNLQVLIGGFKNIIKQRLQQSESLLSLLKEIRSIAERQSEARGHTDSESSRFCHCIIEHIETLGWEKLVHVDAAFTQLHFQYIDKGKRSHILKLSVGNQYPIEGPLSSVELPSKFDLHWTAQGDLSRAYEQFTSAVDTYQEFWDLMQEVDDNTWVLEPEKPTFCSRHRRVAISSSISIQITVDPDHPRALPECKFLGSDQAIAPIKHSMNTNLHLWDEDCRLLENLQTLLGVSFPSPSNSKKEEFSVECAICYAYRMEEAIPDEVCNNSLCAQTFHKSCLVEWLRALPSSRRSFNTIFGNCPYCEKAMTVKMIVK